MRKTPVSVSICAYLWFLLLFVVVSRAIFWPAHPPNFDFANFVLGVYRFAPIDHQPQPPGYPLAILLARVFTACGLSAVQALCVTALIGSLAAVWGAYRLGRRLSTDWGGLLAASLLAIEPSFWFSGVTSPTRPYLAAGVCWLLDFLLELAGGRERFLWLTAGLLALLAGFRPELPVFFAAPCLIAARLGGVAWRKIALATALCLGLGLPWLAWMAWGFGSFHRMLYVHYHYFLHHLSTTSAFFGAPAGASRNMLRDSLLWNSFSAAAAALAAVVARKRVSIDRRFYLLAGVYFIPALFMQVALHASPRAPDHSLGTITVLCVLAGSLLGAARVLWVPALAAAGILSISFAAPGTLFRELDLLSLRSFAKAQRAQAEIIQSLKTSLGPGDAILAAEDSPIPGRILEAEFPRAVVVVLSSPIQERPGAPPSGWRFFDLHQTPLGEEILLAPVNRLHIFANPTGPQHKLIMDRLCRQFRCKTLDSRAQVELAAASGPVSLPPYTLRLVRR